jgi:hypothetical protein
MSHSTELPLWCSSMFPSFVCLVFSGGRICSEVRGRRYNRCLTSRFLGGSVDRAFLYCIIKMWYSVVMCSGSIRTGSSGLCYVDQNNYGVNEHASSIWRVEMRQWHLDNDIINRSIHPDRFLREENKHLDPITRGALISAHCSKNNLQLKKETRVSYRTNQVVPPHFCPVASSEYTHWYVIIFRDIKLFQRQIHYRYTLHSM